MLLSQNCAVILYSRNATVVSACPLACSRLQLQQDRQCTYKVILRRVRETVDAVEK